jgi:cytochrome c553
MPKKKPHPVADQFSDDEMEQLRRYGAALGGSTAFSEEVEKHLTGHEAYYAKMRAVQNVGSDTKHRQRRKGQTKR